MRPDRVLPSEPGLLLAWIEKRALDGLKAAEAAERVTGRGDTCPYLDVPASPIFLADGATMASTNHPLLCLHLAGSGSVRTPRRAWLLHANLSVVNLGLEEVQKYLGRDGVQRFVQ